MSQLIAYMRAPVPASELAAALTCKPVDLTAPGEAPGRARGAGGAPCRGAARSMQRLVLS